MYADVSHMSPIGHSGAGGGYRSPAAGSGLHLHASIGPSTPTAVLSPRSNFKLAGVAVGESPQPHGGRVAAASIHSSQHHFSHQYGGGLPVTPTAYHSGLPLHHGPTVTLGAADGVVSPTAASPHDHNHQHQYLQQQQQQSGAPSSSVALIASLLLDNGVNGVGNDTVSPVGLNGSVAANTYGSGAGDYRTPYKAAGGLGQQHADGAAAEGAHRHSSSSGAGAATASASPLLPHYYKYTTYEGRRVNGGGNPFATAIAALRSASPTAQYGVTTAGAPSASPPHMPPHYSVLPPEMSTHSALGPITSPAPSLFNPINLNHIIRTNRIVANGALGDVATGTTMPNQQHSHSYAAVMGSPSSSSYHPNQQSGGERTLSGAGGPNNSFMANGPNGHYGVAALANTMFGGMVASPPRTMQPNEGYYPHHHPSPSSPQQQLHHPSPSSFASPGVGASGGYYGGIAPSSRYLAATAVINPHARVDPLNPVPEVTYLKERVANLESQLRYVRGEKKFYNHRGEMLVSADAIFTTAVYKRFMHMNLLRRFYRKWLLHFRVARRAQTVASRFGGEVHHQNHTPHDGDESGGSGTVAVVLENNNRGVYRETGVPAHVVNYVQPPLPSVAEDPLLAAAGHGKEAVDEVRAMIAAAKNNNNGNGTMNTAAAYSPSSGTDAAHMVMAMGTARQGDPTVEPAAARLSEGRVYQAWDNDHALLQRSSSHHVHPSPHTLYQQEQEQQAQQQAQQNSYAQHMNISSTTFAHHHAPSPSPRRQAQQQQQQQLVPVVVAGSTNHHHRQQQRPLVDQATADEIRFYNEIEALHTQVRALTVHSRDTGAFIHEAVGYLSTDQHRIEAVQDSVDELAIRVKGIDDVIADQRRLAYELRRRQEETLAQMERDRLEAQQTYEEERKELARRGESLEVERSTLAEQQRAHEKSRIQLTTELYKQEAMVRARSTEVIVHSATLLADNEQTLRHAIALNEVTERSYLTMRCEDLVEDHRRSVEALRAAKEEHLRDVERADALAAEVRARDASFDEERRREARRVTAQLLEHCAQSEAMVRRVITNEALESRETLKDYEQQSRNIVLLAHATSQSRSVSAVRASVERSGAAEGGGEASASQQTAGAAILGDQQQQLPAMAVMASPYRRDAATPDREMSRTSSSIILNRSVDAATGETRISEVAVRSYSQKLTSADASSPWARLAREDTSPPSRSRMASAVMGDDNQEQQQQQQQPLASPSGYVRSDSLISTDGAVSGAVAVSSAQSPSTKWRTTSAAVPFGAEVIPGSRSESVIDSTASAGGATRWGSQQQQPPRSLYM